MKPKPVNTEKAEARSSLLKVTGRVLGAVEILSQQGTHKHCSEIVCGNDTPPRNCPLTISRVSETGQHQRSFRCDKNCTEIIEPLLDKAGIFTGAILTLSTKEENDHKLNNLLQLQKLETIALTTSGIAHDFNNMFACLTGSAALLKPALASMNIEKHVLDLVENIELSTMQGSKLAHLLLELSKGHKPNKSLTALNEVIDQAVSLALVGSHIKTEKVIPDKLWQITANSEQIMQMICNLLINARQAMNEKGLIQIAAENLTELEAALKGLKRKRYVRITIQDDGPGIKQQHQRNIFKPFFTTKTNGTGLGLATAQLITKEHNGHIAFDSETGKGTTFIIYLPVDENEDSTNNKSERSN